MTFTQRFGFTRLDDRTISADGGKFGIADRTTLDRILAALEAHQHEGGQRLGDPTGPPQLSQLDVGGTLPGGTTFYYCVSFVDRFGLETAATDEVSITTPGRLAVPSPPQLTALPGGSLIAGTYYYALTIKQGAFETQISNPAVITLVPGQGTVRLALPPLPSGADGYSIWRQGPTETYYSRIGDTSDPTTDDDGSVPPDDCPTDPANLPPLTNQTNSTNVVIIEVPDPEVVAVPGGPVRAWRIYRTTTSGAWPANSLVAEVTDLDEHGGLVTQFTDTGAPLARGVPKPISQTLTPSQGLRAAQQTVSLLLLTDEFDQVWRVVTAVDGSLVTKRSNAQGQGGVLLTDADGVTWRLEVEADGTLSTRVDVPSATDFTYASGPILPSPDPTVLWQLSVDADGALVTTEV